MWKSVCAAVVAQKKAVLEGTGLDERYPYVVNDQGSGMRGRPFNLTVAWNIMPLVGAACLETCGKPACPSDPQHCITMQHQMRPHIQL